MWANLKKYHELYKFLFVAGIFSGSVYSVLGGYITTEEHWFGMLLWSCMFFMFWILETITASNLRKLAICHNDLNSEMVKLQVNLVEQIEELMMDNKNLIVDNIRLNKNVVHPIRERKGD